MPLKTRGFAHRIEIAAEPPQVWTVLCGPAQLPLWTGRDARIRPQQGGRWFATLAPNFSRDAQIDVFDPPRRLRLIYQTPTDLPNFDGAVVDDILLEGSGDQTILRWLCSGVPDAHEWTGHFLMLRGLTETCVTRLKVLVEQRGRMAAKTPAS
jgi:uncharacterized protein YndB with AHSA1/START domain